jgi:hypothetical protein
VLNFSQRSDLFDIKDIGGVALQSVENVQLDFCGCTALKNIGDFGSVFALPSAKRLEFNFSQCAMLSDISALGSFLGTLQGLEWLKLDFSGYLDLNFGGCTALSEITDLGESVGDLLRGHLGYVRLCFCECTALSDIGNLGSSMQRQSAGTTSNLEGFGDPFQIDFIGCTALSEGLQDKFGVYRKKKCDKGKAEFLAACGL